MASVHVSWSGRERRERAHDLDGDGVRSVELDVPRRLVRLLEGSLLHRLVVASFGGALVQKSTTAKPSADALLYATHNRVKHGGFRHCGAVEMNARLLVACEYAIEKGNVHMKIEVEASPESLDHRDGAALASVDPLALGARTVAGEDGVDENPHERPQRMFAMRGPQQLGQIPRPLQECATSRSWPHVSQWQRVNPHEKTPHRK
jgi:hypothetical protein